MLIGYRLSLYRPQVRQSSDARSTPVPAGAPTLSELTACKWAPTVSGNPPNDLVFAATNPVSSESGDHRCVLTTSSSSQVSGVLERSWRSEQQPCGHVVRTAVARHVRDIREAIWAGSFTAITKHLPASPPPCGLRKCQQWLIERYLTATYSPHDRHPQPRRNRYCCGGFLHRRLWSSDSFKSRQRPRVTCLRPYGHSAAAGTDRPQHHRASMV
jgi:hypothetical protein